MAIAGVMDAVKSAKELAELFKKYNDVPLYEKIVALQGQVTEQAVQLTELIAENKELREKCELKAKIEFRNPYYYEEGSEVPLCPKCYSGSVSKLRIPLTHPPEDYAEGHGRVCRICKEFYREGPCKTPLGGAVVGSESIARKMRGYI